MKNTDKNSSQSEGEIKNDINVIIIQKLVLPQARARACLCVYICICAEHVRYINQGVFNEFCTCSIEYTDTINVLYLLWWLTLYMQNSNASYLWKAIYDCKKPFVCALMSGFFSIL